MIELDTAVANAADSTPRSVLGSLRSWPARRWWVAAVAAGAVAVLVGAPTDVIPNPVFGRPVPVTWWSYPTLVVTAVLGGLLAATYVNGVGPGPRPAVPVDDSDDQVELDAPSRMGSVGGLLSFFAVGCPVCNKLVIIALGTTGARQWFEPVQPVLAVASIGLLAVALRTRLRTDGSCRINGS